MEEVTYKEIPNFPGYWIGSDGSVYSKRAGGKTKENKWKKLQPRISKTGYLEVILRKNGESIHNLIHRLVLIAFIGEPTDKMETRHLDGVPANCYLTNLKWGTTKENYYDRERHGTHPKGSKSPHAKLDENIVLQIRNRLQNGETQSSLAKEFSVHQSSIHDIAARKTWKHI